MDRVVLLILSLVTALPFWATEVIATVSSYNSATITCSDELTAMEVSYSNTNRSKGTVTAGNTATLEISGFPKAHITRIEVWTKSNTSAGAGSLMVSVDETTILSKTGTFASWYGSYSTTYVPLIVTGDWQISFQGSVTILIQATTNSLYLDHVAVTYTESAPTAECLTLFCPTADGAQMDTLTICESAPLSGVILPMSPEVSSWSFIGWTVAPIDETTTKPIYYSAGDIFFPNEGQALYALYTSQPTCTLSPATPLTSGEYVMMVSTLQGPTALSGYWEDNRIPLTPMAGITRTEGGYLWRTSHASPSLRYTIDIENDSATIYYPKEHVYIGHTGTKTTDRPTRWAILEGPLNTYLFYNKYEHIDREVQGLSYDIYYALLTKADEYTDELYASYMPAYWSSPIPFWTLYRVEDLPAAYDATYTTFKEELSALSTTYMPQKRAVKRLLNGVLIIELEGQKYSILGSTL